MGEWNTVAVRMTLGYGPRALVHFSMRMLIKFIFQFFLGVQSVRTWTQTISISYSNSSHNLLLDSRHSWQSFTFLLKSIKLKKLSWYLLDIHRIASKTMLYLEAHWSFSRCTPGIFADKWLDCAPCGRRKESNSIAIIFTLVSKANYNKIWEREKNTTATIK